MAQGCGAQPASPPCARLAGARPRHGGKPGAKERGTGAKRCRRANGGTAAAKCRLSAGRCGLSGLIYGTSRAAPGPTPEQAAGPCPGRTPQPGTPPARLGSARLTCMAAVRSPARCSPARPGAARPRRFRPGPARPGPAPPVPARPVAGADARRGAPREL